MSVKFLREELSSIPHTYLSQKKKVYILIFDKILLGNLIYPISTHFLCEAQEKYFYILLTCETLKFLIFEKIYYDFHDLVPHQYKKGVSPSWQLSTTPGS